MSPRLYDGPRLATVIDDLVSRPARLGATRLLALDGPAGSGKTTLARDLAALLPSHALSVDVAGVAVVSMDDLYDGWAGLRPELEERVVRQLIGPLAQGRPAHWQAYDWTAGAFGSWSELPPPEVLILEGCGSGARRYAPFTSLLVWVEAAPEKRTSRAVARDGAEVLDHWSTWSRDESRHFAANDTRARASLRVVT